MRVNLRRRQIGMAEHHLNRPKIGATLEQMGGKGMPERVRAQRGSHARTPPIAFQNFPEADAGEPRSSAAGVHEQPRTAASADEKGTRVSQIAAHPGGGLIAERNDALLAALSGACQV